MTVGAQPVVVLYLCHLEDLAALMVQQIQDTLAMTQRDYDPQSLPYAQFLNPFTSWSGPYLPIEYFRDESKIKSLMVRKPYKKFESSGTTSSQRSQSFFSEAGLFAYGQKSVQHFEEVLTRIFEENIKNIPGISLIPRVSEWPHSSLAQMVDWIGKKFNVRYASLLEQKSILSEMECDSPIWIFGTAFHFVALYDEGFRAKIPENSVIIETGGTKGKSRAVSREELAVMISDMFDIPQSRIFSEYGMSELACQAYNVPSRCLLSNNSSLSEDHEAFHCRLYHFQDSISLGVMTEPGLIRNEGEGLLVVSDPHRLDFPWPIRTEDRVQLFRNGSFKLLGRAPLRPLKGCSLSVDLPLSIGPELKAPGPFRDLAKKTTSNPKIAATTGLTVSDRAQAFVNFRELLNHEKLSNALTTEFGSKIMAQWAIDDFFKEFPNFTAAMALRTEIEMFKTYTSWDLVLPDNHSIVGWYPILLGYLYGFDLNVRIPQNFCGSNSSLNVFIDECRRLLPGLLLTVFEPTFRYGPQTRLHPSRGLLCFSSEDTKNRLMTWFPGQVQGFGESWALSVVTASELLQADQLLLSQLIREHLSLNQRGCKSSRLVLMLNDIKTSNIILSKTILGTLENYLENKDLIESEKSLNDFENLEFEYVRYHSLGFETRRRHSLLALKEINLGVENHSRQCRAIPLFPVAAQSSGVIPILGLTLEEDKALGVSVHNSATIDFLSQILNHQNFLKQVNFSPLLSCIFAHREKLGSMEIVPIGRGQCQKWNGFHQGQRIFGDLN